MGIDKNIAVIKLSEPTFLRTLENAIRYGQVTTYIRTLSPGYILRAEYLDFE